MNTSVSQESRLLKPLNTIKHAQDTVSLALRELAHPHVDAFEEISLLENDPDLFPAQRITNVYHDSQPADTDTITAVATASNPGFPRMLDYLYDLEEKHHEISRIGEDLGSGGNLVVATSHSDIRDVAEVLAAVHVAVREVGGESQRTPNFTTLLMLSKMLTHIGIYGAPAVDTLSMLCDRQYYSFPRTQTFKEAKIGNTAVTLYNRVLRAVVHHQLAQGGNLLGIALSGTTDKPVKGEPSRIRMGIVGTGTVDIVSSRNTKVLPIAVVRDPSHQIFEITDIPRSTSGAEDVHSLMRGIALTLTEHSVSKKFEYGDLPKTTPELEE